MIRQDEAARRGTSVLFLDTRASALGLAGEAGFERAISAAASTGVLMSRSGFTVRLATAETRPTAMPEDRLLEHLAAVSHAHSSSLAQALVPLRSVAGVDSTLVAVTAPPGPKEIATLTRVGSAFGPKLAILVYPVEPGALPLGEGPQLEGRASVARQSLTRAGWEVVVLSPAEKLKDVWRTNRTRALAPIGSSR
jgi:hypothetical protein